MSQGFQQAAVPQQKRNSKVGDVLSKNRNVPLPKFSWAPATKRSGTSGTTNPTTSNQVPQTQPTSQDPVKSVDAISGQRLADTVDAVRKAREFCLHVQSRAVHAAEDHSGSPHLVLFKSIAQIIATLQSDLEGHVKNAKNAVAGKDPGATAKSVDEIYRFIDLIQAQKPEFERLDALLPEPTKEALAFKHLLSARESEIESAAKLELPQKSLVARQALMKKQYQNARSLAEKLDYPNALKQLELASLTAKELHHAWQEWQAFEAEKQRWLNLQQLLLKLKPADATQKANIQTALDTWNIAQSCVDEGNLPLAQQRLQEFPAQVDLALGYSHDLVQDYDQTSAQAKKIIDEALAVKLLSAASTQKRLLNLQKQMTQAITDHDYLTADSLLKTAVTTAQDILALRDQSQEFQREKAAKAEQISTATILAKQESSPHQAELQRLVQSIDSFARIGRYKLARQSLEQACTLARTILSELRNPQMREYYMDLDKHRDLFDRCAQVQGIYAAVTSRKKRFDQYYADMQQACKDQDFNAALYAQGILISQAPELLEQADQQVAYSAERNAFNAPLKEARAAALKVADGQATLQTMTTSLKASMQAATEDLTVARQQLRLAVAAANKLLAQHRRLEKQNKDHETLKFFADRVERTVLPDQTAQVLARTADQAPFKDLYRNFLATLQNFEKDRNSPSRDTALDDLEAAAKAYVKADTTEPPSSAKQNCQTTLNAVRQLRLAHESKQLPAPPWDNTQLDQHTTLKANLIFEQGYLLGTQDTSGSSNGSYWIKSRDFTDGLSGDHGQRELLFKPVDCEASFPGLPKGGAAVREVFCSAFADRLQETIGLNFGLPQTNPITVDPLRLKLPTEVDASAPTLDPEKPAKGSIQTFAKSLGDLQSLKKGDEKRYMEICQAVSKKSTQTTAIFDLLTLQVDRNVGNVLVTEPDASGHHSLIPIDQGFAIPTVEAFHRRGAHALMGNVLLELPGADEKFDDEMLAAIEQIDPTSIQKIAGELGAETQSRMDDPNSPPVTGPQELLMMTRSAEFLKYAASKLTVKEIFHAIMRENTDLLLCTDSKKQEVFDKAINKVKQLSGALETVNQWSKKQKEAAFTQLQELGWIMPLNQFWEFEFWLLQNADFALKALKQRLPNQRVLAEIKAAVETLKAAEFPPNELQTLLSKPFPRRYYSLLDESQRVTVLSEQEKADCESVASDVGILSQSAVAKRLLLELSKTNQKTLNKIKGQLENVSDQNVRVATAARLWSEAQGNTVDSVLAHYQPDFNDANPLKIADLLLFHPQILKTEKTLGLSYAEAKAFCHLVAYNASEIIPLLTKCAEYRKNNGESYLPKAGSMGTSQCPAIDLFKYYESAQALMDMESKLAKRISSDKCDREVPEAEQQQIMEGIATLFKLDLHDSGVCEAFLTDLGRSDLAINGENASRNVDFQSKANSEGVQKLKTAIPDPRMLAAVTQVTHQGILGDVYVHLSNPANLPVNGILQPGGEKVSYNVQALPNQDVLITAECKKMIVGFEDPEKGSVPLDELSHVYAKVCLELRYEEVITGRPTPHLTSPIEYQYNLIPVTNVG